jgi:hypothetical protein
VSKYAPTRTSYDTGDRRWLPDMLSAETHGVTLNGSLFSDTTKYPGGLVKSGTHVGKVTTGGLHGPYSDAASDGRQVSAGLLLNDVVVKTGEKHHVAVVHAGTVKTDKLPASSGHDAAAKADLSAVVFL